MQTLFDTDIKFLAGVGDRRAMVLGSELGLRTMGDILYYFPFRYIDRTKVYKISEITDDSLALIQLRARITGFSYQGEGRKKRFCAEISDSSGSAELVWFRGVSWIEKRLELRREYIIFGRPTIFNGELSLVHPEIESVEVAANRPAVNVQGVYSTTEKLSTLHLDSKGIFSLVCNAWKILEPHITETLPPAMLAQHNLMGLREALYNIHFPENQAKLKAAEYRLKFEELFGIELGIMSQRSGRVTRQNGFVFPKVGELFNTFYNTRIPFELTGAQKRVIKEIRADTITGHQMNRLLQGDVGSGKTLVALISMILASDNGYQSCMMAPTEILARQHYASISKLVDGLGIGVGILTGSSTKKERTAALEGIANGEIGILLGTHALIEESVQFSNLGFVVIDEQHRFGVEQRSRLWTKNHQPPHVLVMTATPIPRTLAMTLYGDLDVSIIDELPPGRKPIRTLHYFDSHRLRMFGFMRDEIAKGRQVYMVYPLIKESEKMDYKDLYEGFENITQEFPLPKYVTTAVHGKMKPADKAQGMELFTSGVAHIMVATSVIEVGVDVPNASIMVIESAERFGLSQLHQLRGRVGRGAEQSFCILMSGDKLSKEARERLRAMCQTNDGFELAELDMRLRGAGDIHGKQQSGFAIDLKIANISRDGQIIELTRNIAIEILDADPTLSLPENILLRGLKQKFSIKNDVDFSSIS